MNRREFKYSVNDQINGTMKKTIHVYRAEVPGMYEHPLFYTTSKKTAEVNKDWKHERHERKMVINEYDLTFDNPLKLPASGSYMAIEYMAGEKQNPYFLDLLDKMDAADSDMETERLILEGEKELMNWATEEGYDGIIMGNMVIDLRHYDPEKFYPDKTKDKAKFNPLDPIGLFNKR